MTHRPRNWETRSRNDEQWRHDTEAAADRERRTSLRRALKTIGVELSPISFEMAFARVTTAEEMAGDVSEAQIRSIVDDVVSSTEIMQGVAESFR